MSVLDIGRNALLVMPPTMLVSVGGVVAALLLGLLILRRGRSGAIGFVVLVVIVVFSFGGVAAYIHQRLGADSDNQMRSLLLYRAANLVARELAPGSRLSCLDFLPSETVASGCEQAIFSDPANIARAVAYVAAELRLLREAGDFARKRDPAFFNRFIDLRRSIELDRFGIAAQVLEARDSCMPEKCAAFSYLQNVTVLKANLRSHLFDQIVARHAGDWNHKRSVETRAHVSNEKPPLSPPNPTPNAPVEHPASVAHPVPSWVHFPSAASIPPVSIMNPEPALPKSTGANAKDEKAQNAQTAPAKAIMPRQRPSNLSAPMTLGPKPLSAH